MTLLSLRTLCGMGGTSYPLTQQGKRCPDHLSPDLRGLTLPLHCIYFYACPEPWSPGLATSRSWGNAQQAVAERPWYKMSRMWVAWPALLPGHMQEPLSLPAQQRQSPLCLSFLVQQQNRARLKDWSSGRH